MTEQSYVFKIKDATGAIVAEAPIILHDAAAAIRIWEAVIGSTPAFADIKVMLDGAVKAHANPELSYVGLSITEQPAEEAQGEQQQEAQATEAG